MLTHTIAVEWVYNCALKWRNRSMSCYPLPYTTFQHVKSFKKSGLWASHAHTYHSSLMRITFQFLEASMLSNNSVPCYLLPYTTFQYVKGSKSQDYGLPMLTHIIALRWAQNYDFWRPPSWHTKLCPTIPYHTNFPTCQRFQKSRLWTSHAHTYHSS